MSIIWREDGRQWGRLPLEMPPAAFRVAPCEAGSYVYEGEWHGERDIVLGYRNTRVENLVRGANTWTGEVLGQGIFASTGFGNGCLQPHQQRWSEHLRRWWPRDVHWHHRLGAAGGALQQHDPFGENYAPSSTVSTAHLAQYA